MLKYPLIGGHIARYVPISTSRGTVYLLYNEYANYRHKHNFCFTRSFSLIFEVCTRSSPWLVPRPTTLATCLEANQHRLAVDISYFHAAGSGRGGIGAGLDWDLDMKSTHIYSTLSRHMFWMPLIPLPLSLSAFVSIPAGSPFPVPQQEHKTG